MIHLKSKLTFIFLSMTIAASPVFAAAETCPAFPYFKPISGPLAIVNCDFHKQYEQRVEQLIRSFGAVGGRPVLLNLGGTLVFKYNGKTETVDITPAAYHTLKTFCHQAFAIYLALPQTHPGKLDAKLVVILNTLLHDLKKATISLNQLDLSAEQLSLCQQLSALTENFLNNILNKQEWTNADLDQYFLQARPVIHAILNQAGIIELTKLNTAVNRWLAMMPTKDQQQLGVVVATAHQARQDEITLQYFAKKFGYRYGAGAQYENGYVVLEGKFDEASALALLARNYLDRAAAQVIFGDPGRLQRDALADSAKDFFVLRRQR